MKNVEEKVKTILEEQLAVNPSIILNESHLVDDLGADSLDAIEISLALEEEFNIEIPAEDVPRLSLVSDVVEYIKTKLGADGQAV